MNYVPYAIPYFIVLMLVEYVYGRWRGKQTYRLNDTINSLQLGILSRIEGLVRLGFAGVAFAWVADVAGVTPLPASQVWVWIVAFIGYDVLYYWKHRFGHEWRLLWASHVAHHQSEEFNLSTALRQTGTDYIGFLFYVPLYAAGIPVEVVVSVASLNLIYQFWVHTEHIRRLGVLEWLLVTPSNHRVHHARNPRYIDKNYGGVFIVWDRLFGSFADERDDEPCVYGITRALKSWNPLWANFHIWYETARICCKTRRLRDKVRIWFKGPGWYPGDMQPDSSAQWRYAKFDPPVAASVKWYAFVQLWLLIAGTLWLIDAQDLFSRSYVVMATAWLIFALFVHGALLEGRPGAPGLEWLRLGLLLCLAVAATAAADLDADIWGVLMGYTALSVIAFGGVMHMRRAADARTLTPTDI